MSLFLTIVVIMLLFANPPLTESMSSLITYELDHEFAGDLASLGIEYQSSDDNDFEIVVTIDKWNVDDDVFTFLEDNCNSYC